MSDTKRLTITVPAEIAADVDDAVETGDYASASDVVQAALRSWRAERAARGEPLAALKADIQEGLADLAAGRVHPFDVSRIVSRGRASSPGDAASD